MKKTLLLLTMLGGFAFSANAQSIWTNTIDDSNPSASNPFTTGQVVAPNLTVSGIGRGAGINANAGSNRYNATAWSTGGLDVTDYFTFTLTPSTGFLLNLTSFVYTGQASGSGPVAFAFRSSLDGFAANIGTPTATGTTISLSAASFQGVTSPIEFRFFGSGASSAAGTYSVNDFTYNGTLTAVPEPHVYGLVIAGLLLVLTVIRRRKESSIG